MAEKKEFIPALGYNWLTGFYDFTIRLAMPEKKFRAKLIDERAPSDKEQIPGTWLWSWYYSQQKYVNHITNSLNGVKLFGIVVLTFAV